MRCLALSLALLAAPAFAQGTATIGVGISFATEIPGFTENELAQGTGPGTPLTDTLNCCRFAAHDREAPEYCAEMQDRMEYCDYYEELL